MEWYWWVLIIYLGIGAMKALNHLGMGRCGAHGLGATFVAITLYGHSSKSQKTSGLARRGVAALIQRGF